jgi:hypothetical protein
MVVFLRQFAVDFGFNFRYNCTVTPQHNLREQNSGRDTHHNNKVEET